MILNFTCDFPSSLIQSLRAVVNVCGNLLIKIEQWIRNQIYFFFIYRSGVGSWCCPRDYAAGLCIYCTHTCMSFCSLALLISHRPTKFDSFHGTYSPANSVVAEKTCCLLLFKMKILFVSGCQIFSSIPHTFSAHIILFSSFYSFFFSLSCASFLIPLCVSLCPLCLIYTFFFVSAIVSIVVRKSKWRMKISRLKSHKRIFMNVVMLLAPLFRSLFLCH